MDDDDILQFYHLHSGTVVYHGTSLEFDETYEALDAPFWVSDSMTVAEEFVTWNEGNHPRVITYKTAQDMRLVLINDRNDILELGERFGIDMYSPQDMASDVCSMLPGDGWIIPYNYPSGADIMLCFFNLEYVRTDPVG